MKKKNARLTKEMLEKYGITDVYYDNELQLWRIKRLWHKTNSKEKQITFLTISRSVSKHKFTKDKTYPIVGFSYNQKPFCISLSRFLYAWFYGEVPEGMEVDHIDNNPFNNALDNLQLLTTEENLKKRFEDNPDACRNQFDVIKKKQLNEKLANSYNEAQSILVDITNALAEIGKSKPDFAEKELELLVEDLKDRYNDVVRYEK